MFKYLLLSIILFISIVQGERLAAFHYTFSPTNMQCLVAPCDQFTLHKVNAVPGENDITVLGFHFDPTNSRINKSVVVESLPESVIVYGVLEPSEWANHYYLYVINYYAVLLHNSKVAATGKYYTIKNSGIFCITTPCPYIAATEVSTGTESLVNEYTTPYENVPQFDLNWLNAQLFDVSPHNAIVQAEISADNNLIVQRAFVNLPDPDVECPPVAVARCIGSQRPVYARDSNRCLRLDKCVRPGACILSIPTCLDGYRLVSFPSAPRACPSYYCDASFLENTTPDYL